MNSYVIAWPNTNWSDFPPFSTCALVRVSTWCYTWPQQYEQFQLWSWSFTFICWLIFLTLQPLGDSRGEVPWLTSPIAGFWCPRGRASCRQDHRGATNCSGNWKWEWVTPLFGYWPLWLWIKLWVEIGAVAAPQYHQLGCGGDGGTSSWENVPWDMDMTHSARRDTVLCHGRCCLVMEPTPGKGKEPGDTQITALVNLCPGKGKAHM